MGPSTPTMHHPVPDAFAAQQATPRRSARGNKWGAPAVVPQRHGDGVAAGHAGFTANVHQASGKQHHKLSGMVEVSQFSSSIWPT